MAIRELSTVLPDRAPVVKADARRGDDNACWKGIRANLEFRARRRQAKTDLAQAPYAPRSTRANAIATGPGA
jgi:hypothetical protein